MIVYDDLEPSEKIKVYDKGITLNGNGRQRQRRQAVPDARRLPHRRHVGAAARHDRSARRRAARSSSTASSSSKTPITDGHAGLRVVRILEAATESLRRARPRHRTRPREVRSMIPFLDLKAQYHEHQARDRRARSLGVLESTQFVLGEEVAAFEREFAAYCGAKHGIAVNSGTSALHLALLAAGVGPGDEVITSRSPSSRRSRRSATPARRRCSSTSSRVSFTMDPAQLEAAITPRTKAILPVHLYGQMADMDRDPRRSPTATACRSSRTPARRTAPSTRAGRAGSLGDVGCFSFYPGQEPRRLRRGRHGRHQRRRRTRRRSGCCATGARRSGTTTC